MLRPGDSIAGRYEILRSVRSGGLSVVFEAADRETDEHVAVKIINVQPREDAALFKRIEREIKILTSLSHPHVVACHGSGALPDGRPYLVLEWLEGEDLADFKSRAPMTLRRVLEVTGQVADALAAAHTLGIIHRDIKPANIYLVRPLLNARLDCRVIDFGVAKMPQANAAITRAGAILGTPSYMAPEQASYAMDVDARADVFSLGVVTFELLTGRLPWQSSTDLARLARIMVEPPIHVHDLNPEVPNTVAEFIDQMLKLKAADRLASARAVHDRVLSALDALPEGILDTTYTRDQDLLSSFVREPTRDMKDMKETPREAGKPATGKAIADLKTQGLDFGPKGFQPFLEPRVEDVVVKDPAEPKNKERSSSILTEALDPHPPIGTEPVREPSYGEVETPVLAEPLPPPVPAVVDGPPAPVEDAGSADSPKRSRGSVAFVEMTPSSLLFGRVQEIDALRVQVMRTLNADRPSATIIVGPAGIGKTRVRAELTKLVRSISKPPLVLSGRAEEGARSSPYAFLRRLLFQQAHIHSTDTPAEKQKKLFDLLPAGQEVIALLNDAEPPLPGQIREEDDGPPLDRTHFSIDELWPDHPSLIASVRDVFPGASSEKLGEEERATAVAFLATALRFPNPAVPPLVSAQSDPRLMGAQVRRSFDILLRHLAKKRGLVVLIDDAHLLDHSSALVLAGLTKPERGLPVALFAFGLAAILDRNQRRRSPLADNATRTVELQPLDARASREFVRSLVKGDLESGSLELLVERAHGNPLYLEQLVRAVQTTGVLAPNEGGEFELKGLELEEPDDDQVPPTIAAAVAQRIGKLHHELARTLSAAAVFGEVFWIEGVAKLTGQEVSSTARHLDELQTEGMVRRRSTDRYRQQTEMEFTHAVVRSVALARLKKKKRQRFEREVIEHLTQAGEDDEALLAAHLAHAGRVEEAVGLYASAAESSLAIGSLETAAALADEGLLTGGGGIEPRAKQRLLDIAERTAVWRRDFESASEALEGLVALASGDVEQAWIRVRKSRVALMSTRFEEAKREALSAQDLFKRGKEALGEAEALVALGEAVEALGDGRAALRAFIQAQSAFSANDDAKGMARATRGLARIAVSSGDYRTAENRFREALVHAHTTRDRENIFFATCGLAEVARLMGHADKAREFLDDAMRVAVDDQRYLFVEVMRGRLFQEDLEIAEAKKKLDRVAVACEGRAELDRVRRLSVLYLAQLALLRFERSPFTKEQLASLKGRLEEVASRVAVEEPCLQAAAEMALAVILALGGELEEAKKRGGNALARFSGEGAVVEDEPPLILLAHARILEAAQERKEEIRQAWKAAVEHLDSIASRLERKARKRYLSRSVAETILHGAEKAGLKLSRNASSNRIAAGDV